MRDQCHQWGGGGGGKGVRKTSKCIASVCCYKLAKLSLHFESSFSKYQGQGTRVSESLGWGMGGGVVYCKVGGLYPQLPEDLWGARAQENMPVNKFTSGIQGDPRVYLGSFSTRSYSAG